MQRVLSLMTIHSVVISKPTEALKKTLQNKNVKQVIQTWALLSQL